MLLDSCNGRFQSCTAAASFVFLFCLILMAPAPLAAQASFTGDDEDQSDIIVTARRRVENLLYVPIAVTPFGEKEIEARSATSLADLVNVVPNSMFDTTAPLSGSSNSASIFIRGIGQSDFAFSTDPGVAVYVDGVYLARATGSAFDLVDLDRVEVLRGPQGTLFGRNSIGGAVSVVTNSPQLNDASLEAEAILGSGDKLGLTGVLNAPIGSHAALRLVATHRQDGSEGRRLIDGEGLGGHNAWQLRGRLRWEPTTRLRFDLVADYANLDDESPVTSLSPVGPQSAIGAPTTLFAGILYNNLIEGPDGIAPCARPDFVLPFCGLPGVIQLPTLPAGTPSFDARWLTGSRVKTFATGPTGSRFEGGGLGGTVQWGGPVSIRWIGSWRRFEAAFGRDPDSAPLVIVDTMNLLDHTQLSQELQVSDSTPDFEWVAGVYWFKEDGTDRATAPLIDETFRVLRRLGLGCTLLPGATGLPAPVFVPECPNIFRIDYAGDGVRVANRSLSAFGEGSLDLNDWLTVTAGLRWTRDRKEVDISGFLVGGVPVSPNPVARRTFSRLTPRLIVQVKPKPDMMLYASYSTGFKSGGFNQRYGAPIAAPTSFEPEEVRSVEIGWRTSVLHGQGRLAATGFWSDYENIQAVVFDGGIPRTVNAAKGRSRGIELEAVLTPARGVRLSASYGYLDARFTRLDTSIIGSFGVPIVNPLRTDFRFVNSPRHSGSLSAEYTHYLGPTGTVTLRGDVSYRSSVANDAVNTPELVQRPVTLLNARLTYAPHGDRWSASLFGTNLLDETYIVSGAADPAGFGAAEVNVAQSRRWGVSLQIEL